MLNRRHATEIVALTNLLGGWGQPRDTAGMVSNSNKTASMLSYQGTQGQYWQNSSDSKVSEATIESTTTTTTATTATTSAATPCLLDAWATVHAPEEVYFATLLALLGYLRDPPSSNSSSCSNKSSSSANSSSANSSTTQQTHSEVKLTAINYAQWARRGDAHPIQYSHINADIVVQMLNTGALFGRKFAAYSVDASEWRSIVQSLPTISTDKATNIVTNNVHGNNNEIKKERNSLYSDMKVPIVSIPNNNTSSSTSSSSSSSSSRKRSYTGDDNNNSYDDYYNSSGNNHSSNSSAKYDRKYDRKYDNKYDNNTRYSSQYDNKYNTSSSSSSNYYNSNNHSNSHRYPNTNNTHSRSNSRDYSSHDHNERVYKRSRY